jgi:redox-sensitive bicupin YhaK (pirin superfamily)
LRLLASPDGAEVSLVIGQDARIYASLLNGNEHVQYQVPKGRRAYVHVARGEISLNGNRLAAGDGVSIADDAELSLSEGKGAEVLLFDLA